MAIKGHRVGNRHRHTAVAVLDSETEAVRAVRELHRVGFTNEQMTLLAKDDTAVAHAIDEVGVINGREIEPADTLAEEVEPKGRDELFGMLLGGLIGFVAGLGMLLIPGFGTFLIQAGPLAIAMHCLTTAACGLGLGILLGAINDERVTEGHRDLYHEKLDSGKWLLVVHGDDEDILRATEHLRGFSQDPIEAF